ncbi:hypothetical protein PDIDSM_1837, partial [Penicillium digitatum]
MADHNSPDYKFLYLQTEERRRQAEDEGRQEKERRERAEEKADRRKRDESELKRKAGRRERRERAEEDESEP